MDTQICPTCNQIGALKAKNKKAEEIMFDCKKKQKVKKYNKQYKYKCEVCGHKFKEEK